MPTSETSVWPLVTKVIRCYNPNSLLLFLEAELEKKKRNIFPVFLSTETWFNVNNGEDMMVGKEGERKIIVSIRHKVTKCHKTHKDFFLIKGSQR